MRASTLVDLNLGCPAKRVVSCNGGSGLLRDLPRIREIFEEIRSAVSIPFTVKFRMGWNDSNIVCVELAKMAEDCGLNCSCAARPHARARLLRRRALGVDCRSEGRSDDPRDWQWRHSYARRCGSDGRGHRLRCGNDWPRCCLQIPGSFVRLRSTRHRNRAPGLGVYDKPTNMDRYRMIRDYFERLMAEVAEHPEVLGRLTMMCRSV